MLVRIPGLLTAEEVRTLVQRAAVAQFTDGRRTAQGRAAMVKNNLQMARTEGQVETLREIARIAIQAMLRNPVFRSVSVPKSIRDPIISRYVPGMAYGAHVDAPVMDANGLLRSDVATTIFLSDPASYDGGELVIDSPFGPTAVKLPPGSAVVYPASTLHRVAPVTRGERLAVVTWIQSLIRDPARREALHELGLARTRLAELEPNGPFTDAAFRAHANLMRMWVEV